MPTRRSSIIAAIALSMPSLAMAAFVDETAAPAPAPAATAAPAAGAAPAPVVIPVRLEGDAPKVIPPSRGKGQRIALATALAQFAPGNFQITLSDRIDPTTQVDWTGRPQWITTLSEVMKSAGVVAVLNWQRETLVVKTSFDEPDKPATWTLKAGDRVSTRLNDWSRQNGWQLAWEAKELVVEGVDMSATGTFIEAVATFIEALNAAGAEVRARFYMDNSPPVLRITERVR